MKNTIIEGIPFDLDIIIKQLKQDMRDDWFPDTLNYEDMLDPNKFRDIFAKYSKSASMLYDGFDSAQYNLPKQGFVLRYGLEMSPWDRIIYHGLAKHLIVLCDKHLNPCVYSHRWNAKSNSKYLFLNAIDSWKQFEESVRINLTNKTPFLLVTDIQNFFENIRISDVKKSLKRIINKNMMCREEEYSTDKAINMMARLLKQWSPYLKHGIPQNRDASSFLGNILLHDVDNAMLNLKYKYSRYMDDIRFICHDQYEARKALRDLIIELRKIGLNVNAKKTFIVHKDDPEISKHVVKANREIEQIDALWKSKRLPNIRITLPLLRNMTLKLIADGRTQDREFRFCLHRLENIARCRETRSSFDFSSITDSIISELKNQPYSSDSLIRFLKCIDLSESQKQKIGEFLCNNNESIYEWQNYHIWQLLINHNWRCPPVDSYARRIISSTVNDPDKAGAILYLGAFGEEQDRYQIATEFKKMKSFLLQRNAMIATHELSYPRIIKPLMHKYVRTDLSGTYRTLKQSFMGTYYRPLEPIRAVELYRDLPSYN